MFPCVTTTHCSCREVPTGVNEHTEVPSSTSTDHCHHQPSTQAVADGFADSSAHVHSPTESSEAGSPSEQLSHQPAERRDSIAAQHSARGSQADAGSHSPVATSGNDSPCSEAGLGNNCSGSFVSEQPAAAAASAEARNGIRGTSQETQAEDLFAAWYGAPPPSPPSSAQHACQSKPASKRCAAACC